MDAEAIRSAAARGESLDLEFKDGSINDRDLVEAVACLANGAGGHLLIGVADDGTVVGADVTRATRADPRRLEALIAARTEPPLVVEAEVVAIDDRRVISVHVPIPESVVATSDGTFLRRVIAADGRPQCLPMRPHEVVSRAGSAGPQDFARIALPVLSEADLDSTELDRFRELATLRGDSAALGRLGDADLLAALDLVHPTGALTVGALLLFGREPVIARLLPAYSVAFQELAGTALRARESRTMPIMRAMRWLSEQVGPRNPENEIDVGLLRVAIPRFSDVALRELIANALVHRDYALPGATLVAIDEAGLTVTNPGGFPVGVTTANLLTTPPRPRNPVLANAFRRAGLVEQTGRGIARAFEGQLVVGHEAPDYGQSTGEGVAARLFAGIPDLSFAGFVADLRTRGEELSLSDLMLLHRAKSERSLSTREAAALLQKSPEEARAALNTLADRGFLKARGATAGRSYHLAASLYRRLGEPAQYVRARGFDDLQQEQMVLTFVARHGSISRSEAADLCNIEPAGASRLLRRLRDEGKLRLEGAAPSLTLRSSVATDAGFAPHHLSDLDRRIETALHERSGPDGFVYDYCKLFAVARKPD